MTDKDLFLGWLVRAMSEIEFPTEQLAENAVRHLLGGFIDIINGLAEGRFTPDEIAQAVSNVQYDDTDALIDAVMG